MCTIKKALSAGLLGGLYLFDPSSVSAIPSKGPGSMDIQTFPMSSDICPRFPYFDQMPKHDYCPLVDYSYDHKVNPVTARSLFEVSSDFFISTAKKIYWFAEALIINKNELLFQAVQEDNTDKATYLMENGADINAKDFFDGTLLHYVRNKRMAQCAKDHGIDSIAINAKDSSGQTPLFRARDKDLVKWLIDNGADVNAKDKFGVTLLEDCLEVFYNKEKAQLLIDNGADINAKDYKGRNFLEYFLEVSYYKEKAQWLIDNGADVNAKNKDGQTSLHIVSTKEAAQWLLSNGAEINVLDRYNQNPLNTAKTTELAKFFQARGLKLFRGNGKDKVFVFYASDAFSDARIRFVISNLTDFSTDYSVGIRTIEEYGQLIETLDNIPRKSLNWLIVVAHGSRKKIVFGEGSEKGSLSKDKFPKEQLRQIFKKALASDATVILHSCSTAFGTGSIAYDILQTLPVGTKLIAAEGIVEDEKLRVNNLKPFDISFFGIKREFNELDSFSGITVDEKREDITVRLKREQTKKQAAKKASEELPSK